MQSLSWQEQIAQAIRCPNELLDYIGLQASGIGYSEQAIQQFPLRVPYAYADRIKRQDPDDPLLRQIFPYLAEEENNHHYINDPLSEAQIQPIPGLLHKYKNRVLVITTGACAIHCRYCFRRHFPYQDASALGDHWQQTLDYIQQHQNIDEVILSGGDPLSLPDQRLLEMYTALSEIDHIKRIRLHTRIPVVLPDRLSAMLIQAIATSPKKIIFVLHINHANELDAQVSSKVRLLQSHNIPVLNQSVLLKGVNDSADALLALSECLIALNITPYYLHLLDPVAGAAHFAVPLDKAQQIIRQMQRTASGYLIPRLVKDECGKPSKSLLA